MLATNKIKIQTKILEKCSMIWYHTNSKLDLLLVLEEQTYKTRINISICIEYKRDDSASIKPSKVSLGLWYVNKWYIDLTFELGIYSFSLSPMGANIFPYNPDHM